VDHVHDKTRGVDEAHALAAARLGVGLDGPTRLLGQGLQVGGRSGTQAKPDRGDSVALLRDVAMMGGAGSTHVESVGGASGTMQPEVHQERFHAFQVGCLVANKGDVDDVGHAVSPASWTEAFASALQCGAEGFNRKCASAGSRTSASSMFQRNMKASSKPISAWSLVGLAPQVMTPMAIGCSMVCLWMGVFLSSRSKAEPLRLLID
jgi:hypothetical protein